MNSTIHWLGHATVLIQGQKRVVVDPWKVQDVQPVDLVLVTHDHFDHCSPPDVDKVRGPGTQVLGPADVAAKLGQGTTSIAPGQSVSLAGIKVEAVPAYNLDKDFHPRARGWVGYVVEMAGERIYIAGDTDHTPEMDEVRADVALLPVGGTYTMDAREAAEAANRIRPSLAIPIHFGDIVGSQADADRFAYLCRVPVRVLKPGEHT